MDTATSSNTRSGSESPSAKCPICLSQIENSAYTDKCFHQFCFTCLLEWSKVNAVCPLCKQEFRTIVYDVQSYAKFKEMPVKVEKAQPSVAGFSISGVITHRLLQPNVDQFGEARFRYRTTMSWPYRQMMRRLEEQRLENLLRYPSHRIATDRYFIFSEEARLAVYRAGLRVQHLENRSDEAFSCISPRFFANNPACKIRLFQWLQRELKALLHFNYRYDVDTVLHLIMDILDVSRLTSRNFYAQLRSYTGHHTHHFLQELYCFAHSAPCTMSEYDSIVVYGEGTSGAIWAEWHKTEARNDSDVPRAYNSSQRSSLLPSDRESLSFPSLKRSVNRQPVTDLHYTNYPNNHSSESSTPGTSGAIIRSPWSVHVVDSSDDDEDNEGVTLASNLSVDDDVLIVDQEPAWNSRLPIVISDDSDEDTGQVLNDSVEMTKNKQRLHHKALKRKRESGGERDESDKIRKKANKKRSSDRHHHKHSQKSKKHKRQHDSHLHKPRQHEESPSDDEIYQSRDSFKKHKNQLENCHQKLPRQEERSSSKEPCNTHSKEQEKRRHWEKFMKTLLNRKSLKDDMEDCNGVDFDCRQKFEVSEAADSDEKKKTDASDISANYSMRDTESYYDHTSNSSANVHSALAERRTDTTNEGDEEMTAPQDSNGSRCTQFWSDDEIEDDVPSKFLKSEIGFTSLSSGDGSAKCIERFSRNSSPQSMSLDKIETKVDNNVNNRKSMNETYERAMALPLSVEGKVSDNSSNRPLIREGCRSANYVNGKGKFSERCKERRTSLNIDLADCSEAFEDKHQAVRKEMSTLQSKSDLINAVFCDSVIASNGTKFKKHFTGHKNSHLKEQNIDYICKAIENYGKETI